MDASNETIDKVTENITDKGYDALQQSEAARVDPAPLNTGELYALALVFCLQSEIRTKIDTMVKARTVFDSTSFRNAVIPEIWSLMRNGSQPPQVDLQLANIADLWNKGQSRLDTSDPMAVAAAFGYTRPPCPSTTQWPFILKALAQGGIPKK